MPKSTAKQSEELVGDAFDRAGYETYIPPKAKFREQDVFEEFDLLAFGREPLWGGPATIARLWFVQVKTNQPRGINDWFQRAADYERVSGVRIGYAVVHTDGDRDAVRFATSASDGYEWVVDERKDGTPAEGEGVVEYLRGET